MANGLIRRYADIGSVARCNVAHDRRRIWRTAEFEMKGSKQYLRAWKSELPGLTRTESHFSLKQLATESLNHVLVNRRWALQQFTHNRSLGKAKDGVLTSRSASE